MGRQARDQRHLMPLVRRLAEEHPARPQHPRDLRKHPDRVRQMLEDVVGEDQDKAGIRVGDGFAEPNLAW